MADPNPFSPQALAQSVHDTLDDAMSVVPPGKRGALLVDATAQGQVQLVLATRIGKGWQFGVGAGYDGHHVEGKVALMGSW